MAAVLSSACEIPPIRSMVSGDDLVLELEFARQDPLNADPGMLLIRNRYYEGLQSAAAPGRRDTAGQARSVAVEGRRPLGQMAVDVCRLLYRDCDPVEMKPDAIMVCQTSVETNCVGNDSTCLRLQCEFGVTENSFGLGSQDGAVFFTALALSRDLLGIDPGIQRILICGVERWCSPAPRRLGEAAVLGDGAVAMLLGRDAAAGWTIRAVDIRSVAGFGDVHGAAFGAPEAARYVQEQTALVARLLAGEELRPGDVAWISGPGLDDGFDRFVAAACGFHDEQCLDGPEPGAGYLCAADPMLRLHQFLQSGRGRPGDRLLLWGTGLCGAFGAAILECRE